MNGTKKVLLVDDERAIVKVTEIKLKMSGYDVITASSGQEALNLAKAESPDIMLLDVIMPGVDGFSVLEKLRTYSKMPVIVFSARHEHAKKALSMGADFFVGKPPDFDKLVTMIEGLLGAAPGPG